LPASPATPSPQGDELISQYLPLARRLAARYRHTSEPLEDLVQVASMGLVMAAKRFDPSRGIPFASFAIPTIMGELRRYIRDHGWSMRVPRGLQEDVLRVTAAGAELSGQLGRSPTPGELADYTGVAPEAVLEAMAAATAYEADSLDHRAGDDEGTGESLIATLGRDDPGYDLVEHGAAIGPAMKELPEIEREVVAMRFVLDLTQSEIAARVGISQMQVSRLLRRSLDRLHAATSGDVEIAA
jgi:RNA polymerase sigma-B factor